MLLSEKVDMLVFRDDIIRIVRPFKKVFEICTSTDFVCFCQGLYVGNNIPYGGNMSLK
jgi:hypothetical protein